jgi:tetratricopeptide (TPR) repeat protein
VKRRIFISYRRSDSQDITGRLCDRLVSSFGQRSVFKDVDSIPPGVDFRKHLEDGVAHCELLLAVIGENWRTVTNAAGQRRLDDASDFVRIEIEAAMERGIPVLPVLVGQASMPDEIQLPLTLAPFAYQQAVRVRPDPDFHRDMDRLDSAIKRALEPQRGNRLAGALQRPKSRRLWTAAVLGLLALAVAAYYLLTQQSYRPSQETAGWFGQGLAAFRAGIYERARRIFFLPTRPPATAAALRWYNQGVDAIREGTYYKAGRALEQSLKESPGFPLTHASLAEAWLELDSPERANEEMLRASAPWGDPRQEVHRPQDGCDAHLELHSEPRRAGSSEGRTQAPRRAGEGRGGQKKATRTQKTPKSAPQA